MKLIPALVMAAALLSSLPSPAQPTDFYKDAMDGRRMNADQVAELETAVAATPDDLSSRTKLLGYYFSKGRGSGETLKNRRTHVLWVIKHHPESELAALPYCGMHGSSDPEGYVEAKKLWLDNGVLDLI